MRGLSWWFYSAIICLVCVQKSYGFWPFDFFNNDDQSNYEIGVGIADMTGPCVGVQMFGYVTFNQTGEGIRLRQFSRAFIIAKNGVRVVHVTLEIGAISEVVKMKVLERLNATYGSLYTMDNVVLAATHTHSAPGGYFHYTLYSVLTFGFSNLAFSAAVEGVYNSIVQAHNNLKPGYIYLNSGLLLDCNINRSPVAYENNPWYRTIWYPSNVDKTMTVLKFTDLQLNPLGAIIWFPVHPTSANAYNTLINTDNSGFAALMLEKSMNGNTSLPGIGPFVAAFPQSNHGDSAPYVRGYLCIETGEPCDRLTKKCSVGPCIAQGPTNNDMDDIVVIGGRMAEKALELLYSPAERLSGNIQYIHQHVNITGYVTSSLLNLFGLGGKTCRSALGSSFAGGTGVVGEGIPFAEELFFEGMTTDPPDIIKSAVDIAVGSAERIFNGSATPRNLAGEVFEQVQETFSLGGILGKGLNYILGHPRKETQECQKNKPILLPLANMNFFTNHWAPEILPTQMIKIGQLIIAPVPAEFTTMAGRRMVQKIQMDYRLSNIFAEPVTVIVQSLSNEYASYVNTLEEYKVQSYEGASNIFGGYTLDAFLSQYSKLLSNMLSGTKLPPGPKPPQLDPSPWSMIPGNFLDFPGLFSSYGQVQQNAAREYYVGDTVVVVFKSADPRNNLELGWTYLSVEYLVPGGTWKMIATDASWETRFYWRKDNILMGTSIAIVEWDIEENVTPGTYRIKHYGRDRNGVRYEGTSRAFLVKPRPDNVN